MSGNYKHGNAKSGNPTKEYAAWGRMKSRCSNLAFIEYENYGGRGIKVCDRWNNSFEAFLSDVGKSPSQSHSLDRKNTNGNYEPGNVRWATKIQQMNNTTRTRWLTFNQKRQSLSDWARELGVRPKPLVKRLKTGWSVEQALSTPFKPSCLKTDMASTGQIPQLKST